MTPRPIPITVLAVIALASVVVPAGAAPLPPAVPRVVDGFVLAPLAPAAAPTAIAFGPGDADGPDLYAALYTGSVLRVSLSWTPAGPVASGARVHASGFSSPLGLEFEGDSMLVADSHEGSESGRTDGRIWRVDGASRVAIVDGLPNGRHNTNNLRWGPDGRLYVANGNPNDNGVDGGDADAFPYSGAILSVDLAEVTASPAVLRWRDAAGAAIPADAIASHPVNAEFARKVHVLGYGFRNVYDVAFGPDGAAYTAMNGADDPASQDVLYRISPGADHGFPFCYNEGRAGAVGTGVRVVPNPVFANAARCAGVPAADALIGWHVCGTGLDVPRGGIAGFRGAYALAAYVGECGPFYPDDHARRMAADPSAHNTGHKVAMVRLGADGRATAVEDFVTGLALPTDVHFGPDGAMYVADAAAIYRVAPAGVTA